MVAKDDKGKAGAILNPPAAPVEPQSRGREYLANERTFLAWIRTSVSLISLGFVIERFGLFLRELGHEATSHGRFFPTGTSFFVGEIMMACGGVFAALAAWRYHVVNRDIERGLAKTDRLTVLAVAALVLLLSIVMIAIARP